MSTRIVRIFKVATAAFFVACAPALAQFQVPDHAVPLGRGAASTGFKFAAPVANGVLASTNTSADPAFASAIRLDSLALGGSLIGGSLSTQGTGINSVMLSKQTDGASSTTGTAGFEALSNSADIFLNANGTARTTVRYGVTIGGYSEITAPTGNGMLIGTLNSTPVIIGSNNTAMMTLSPAVIAVPSGVTLALGGGTPFNTEVISAYNGNIVLRGNGSPEIYASQLDGSTSTLGASVMGAVSGGGGSITVDGSLVANGFANTKVRYGLTLGGYVELSAFLGNGFILGTALATPLIFGANNIERGRINASTTEWVIGPGGATVPTLSSTLHVTAADSAQAILGVDAFGAVPFLTLRRADGTKAAPTAVQNGEALGALSFQGRGATTYSASRVEIDAFATENWTDAAQGVRLDFYTTPTGTITAGIVMRLDQDATATFTKSVKTGAVAVGSLPTCNSGAKASRYFVTDSNAASYTAGIGAVVAAGGTTNVPVVCDGTNWRIGAIANDNDLMKRAA